MTKGFDRNYKKNQTNQLKNRHLGKIKNPINSPNKIINYSHYCPVHLCPTSERSLIFFVMVLIILEKLYST
jgi:hypothetical protein